MWSNQGMLYRNKGTEILRADQKGNALHPPNASCINENRSKPVYSMLNYIIEPCFLLIAEDVPPGEHGRSYKAVAQAY